MSSVFIFSADKTSTVRNFLSKDGRVLILEKGVNFVSTGPESVRVIGKSAFHDIRGHIVSTKYGFNSTGSKTGKNEVVVRDNGTILSGYSAVVLNGDKDRLTNFGDIKGHYGVWVKWAEGVQIINHGTLTGREHGVSTISSTGFILNKGTIIGGSGNAINLASGSQTEAIRLNNSGTLEAKSRAVNVKGDADFEMKNSGTIDGDVVTDGGADVLYNSGSVFGTINLRDQNDTVINSGLIEEHILLGSGADMYKGKAGQVLGIVYGGDGDDTLIGGAFADEMRGDGNDDILRGRGEDDILSGGAGVDKLFGGRGEDDLDGGTGNDKLFGGADDDILKGGDGEDELFGGRGDDDLDGDADADHLYGRAGDDELEGGDANDVLSGGFGNDFLSGSAGGDIFYGGRGDDILLGGAGTDLFVFEVRNGSDTIIDFTAGDKIDLTAFGLSTFAGQVDDAISVGASGLGDKINLAILGGEGWIVVEGPKAGSLDASDFIL